MGCFGERRRFVVRVDVVFVQEKNQLAVVAIFIGAADFLCCRFLVCDVFATNMDLSHFRDFGRGGFLDVF